MVSNIFYVRPEDWEHFIFSNGLKPSTGDPVLISFMKLLFSRRVNAREYFLWTMKIINIFSQQCLLSLKHPKTRTILENRPSQRKAISQPGILMGYVSFRVDLICWQSLQVQQYSAASKKWAPPAEGWCAETQAERIVSHAPVLRGYVWLFSGSVVLW